MNVNAKSPGFESGKSYTSPLSRRRFRFGAVLGLSLFFGLLLWARLILVTGHPRTASADPAANTQTHTQPGQFDSDLMKYNASDGTASTNTLEQQTQPLPQTPTQP